MHQLDLGLGPGERPAPREVRSGPPMAADEPSPVLREPPRPKQRPRLSVPGQVRVENFLRRVLGPKILVALTDNRTTMISYSVRRGVTYLRLHAIFADAPEPVLTAIARFVKAPRPGPETEHIIDQWIETHRHLVRRSDRSVRMLPRGEVHNLQKILSRLNLEYFDGCVTARITWSVAARGRKRASIRMGSYSPDEGLIRIHPALDQDYVPEYFVASVVFHEMLHELHGASPEDGHRRVHTPAFRRDEARFRDYGRARTWETRNLHRLLRY